MEFLNTKSLLALFCALFFVGAQAAQVDPDLSRAISADNAWAVEDIIQAGDIDSLDSALLQAVNEEKMGVVLVLLEKGISKLSQEARTQALQEVIEGAIEQDSEISNKASSRLQVIVIAGALLRAGDYPEAVLSDALWEALFAKSEHFVTILLRQGAKPELALRHAIENRNEDPGMVAVVVLQRFPEKLLEVIDTLDDEVVAEMLKFVEMKKIMGGLGSFRSFAL